MGKLPQQAKGMLRECQICGFWYPERDGRIKKVNGKWLCRWDVDSLTDEDRLKSKIN